MFTRLAITFVIFIGLVGCVTTEYKTFEGSSNVIEGKGGTKVIVDGMDIWDNGDPPRRFQLIGLIEDQRPSGVILMSMLKSDIVKKAREAKGDALIQIRSESQIVGYQTNGFANANSYGKNTNVFGSSTSFALKKNTATFAVIKYLD